MKMEKKKVKNNNNDDLKFTPLDINPSLNIGNEKLNSITPPNTLDGISINSDCNNIYIGFHPLGLTSSKYSPLMTNSSLLNSTLNSNNTTGYYPPMPYPNNIPSMDTSNTIPITSPNENILNNEFPSETSSDNLYS